MPKHQQERPAFKAIFENRQIIRPNYCINDWAMMCLPTEQTIQINFASKGGASGTKRVHVPSKYLLSN